MSSSTPVRSPRQGSRLSSSPSTSGAKRDERPAFGQFSATDQNRSRSDPLGLDVSLGDEQLDYAAPAGDSVSPDHIRASASSAVEQADEVPESEETRGAFRRVIDTIRLKCDLPTPTPEVVSSTLSGIERRFKQEPQGTVPCNLPISSMVEATLRAVDVGISGPGKSSLAGKKSKLLPPMPLQKEGHWYEFWKDPAPSPREVSTEVSELLGSPREVLATKGAHLSAPELLVVETLSRNSLRAASWLDHWLVTVSEMWGEEVPSEVRDMLCSGGKAIRYIASQSASLWASSLLLRRDAVLSGNRVLSPQQKQTLRTSSVLESSSLFPETVVKGIKEERQAKQESSLFGNVARLADSAQKAVQKQAASSSGYSHPSSGPKKGKKRPAPSQPKGQGSNAQSAETSEGASTSMPKKGKRSPPNQTFRGGKGKGRGRGGR